MEKISALLSRGFLDDFIIEFCDNDCGLANVVECVSKYSVYDIAQYIWEYASEDKNPENHMEYVLALTLAMRLLGVVQSLRDNVDVFSDKKVYNNLDNGIKISFTTL
jgi:hypothetical protein